VDNELEVIHHQMEGTRASLADKLDTLEGHVLGTVHEATDAVAHTVEDVKSVVDNVTDSIQETVHPVKEAFNLREHVRQHPWMSLSGAMAVGFLGGYLLPSSSSGQPQAEPPPREQNPPPRAEARSSEESSDSGPLQTLKALAIGTLMNLVRESLATSLPENLKSDVLSVVDDITTRLGGKPLRRSEESETEEEQPSSEDREQSSGSQVREHNGHHKQPVTAGQDGPEQGDTQESVGRQDRRRSGPRRR